MTFARIVLVFLAAAPLSFGASKEIQELQRDVAMLQDQVRTMQKDFGDRLVSMQTLVQTTLDAVNRTNNLVNVMENRFNDAMKQQQTSVSGPVLAVGQKLDQMSEDFRAVRESVLDMNTRMGKLDAKLADLQNLVNTIRTPAPPPPGSGDANAALGGAPAQPAGPPAGVSADTLYSNAYRDYTTGKSDLALQEFSDYIKYFPTTQFAANSQYYIGDIYYKRNEIPSALQAFDAVLERFPDGNKTGDAHYMKGLCYVKMARNDSAAAEFRTVARQYADTDPDLAAKAKARLREMGLTVGAATTTRKRR
ncbi:MAG TPA: tetratricopeptide repeat protein [Bryobacteraceae bacterium]|nr:tetratricopeptide repeat protein [Bryobacteraceae bacterium]